MFSTNNQPWEQVMGVFIRSSGELGRKPRSFFCAPVHLAWASMLMVGSLGVPSVAIADIAPDPLSGGVNLSGSTNAIEMSDEAVTLNVTATRCTTNALFQMKNLTDAPVTMEVGFPFAYPGELQDFMVKVDGRVIENLTDKPVDRKRKWKVWTMTFPAKKVTLVEVDYWNEIKATYSWVSGIDSVPDLLLSVTAFKKKPIGQATEEEMRRYNELAAKLSHREIRYILTTGAGWAGKIGKCRVEAKFEGLTSDNLITRFPFKNAEYLPRDPLVERERLVWDLKDFEPKDDIHFQVSPRITRQELQHLIEATLKEHPHHPKFTLLLGEYYTSPSDLKRHEEMVDGMLAAWTVRFAIDGPDYVDKEHAQQSFRVWFAVRAMTIPRGDAAPLSEARRMKLLPTIKALAQRMQSQLPPEGQASSKRLNPYQVSTFRLESQRIIEWVDKQKVK